MCDGDVLGAVDGRSADESFFLGGGGGLVDGGGIFDDSFERGDKSGVSRKPELLYLEIESPGSFSKFILESTFFRNSEIASLAVCFDCILIERPVVNDEIPKTDLNSAFINIVTDSFLSFSREGSVFEILILAKSGFS